MDAINVKEFIQTFFTILLAVAGAIATIGRSNSNNKKMV